MFSVQLKFTRYTKGQVHMTEKPRGKRPWKQTGDPEVEVAERD